MDRITYRTKDVYTTMEISEDKRKVAVFSGSASDPDTPKVGEFDIEPVWDMLRDALVTADAGPISSPGLFRRKGEAAAAILNTTNLLCRR